MSIVLHRTVEHNYEDGSQSVLSVKSLTYDRDERVTLLVSNDYDQSISIHSRDQLERLIANLRVIADEIELPEK